MWLHLQKEHLTGPHCKLRPLRYGPYTITKVFGDNAFDHSPFQVGLGFQALCPIDVAMPFAATHADSAHIQFEVSMLNNFIERIQHIRQQVHYILDRSNAKYKK